MDGRAEDAYRRDMPRPHRRTNATDELLGVLAHELRNPLASLQGCAYTLQEHGALVDEDLRASLTEVIVNQAQRLDWLIGAVAAMGGRRPRSHGEQVDVASIVQGCGRATGVQMRTDGSVQMVADERSLRLALEALLVALGARAGGAARLDHATRVLEVTSAATDLDRGGRAWKLTLARKLLDEQGCRLRVTRSERGVKARVGFPDARPSRIRRTA